MMSKVLVLEDDNTILDEQQIEMLDRNYPDHIRVKIPVLPKESDLADFCDYIKTKGATLIFACYNPYLLVRLAKESGRQFAQARADGFKPGTKIPIEVWVFHFSSEQNRWILVR